MKPAPSHRARPARARLRRTLVGAAALAATAMLGLAAPLAGVSGEGTTGPLPASAPVELGVAPTASLWHETRIAAPVARTMALGATTRVAENGRSYAYYPLIGATERLAVADLNSGEVRDHPVPGAESSWSVTPARDGRDGVYLSSHSQGELYRFTHDRGVEALGRPIPSERFVFGVSSAADGVVYGATYPGGRVFGFDPSTGRSRDYGQMVPGAQYARDVSAAPDGFVYVAVGNNRSTVVRLDPRDGSKQELPLPSPHDREGMTYDIDVAGSGADQVVFARTEQGSLLAYRDGSWHPLGKSPGLAVSTEDPASPASAYYVRDDRRLMRVDLRTLQAVETGALAPGASRGSSWTRIDGMPGMSLALTQSDASTWVYNPATGRTALIASGAKPVPVSLSDFAFSPDGSSLYSSGAQAGGFSVTDLATGATSQTDAIAQGESFLTAENGMIYIGTYPDGVVSVYDPSRPREPGANPRPILSAPAGSRSRPVAAVNVDARTVAFGQIAGYGRNGGEVTFVDTRTHETSTVVPFPDQSVTSLAMAADADGAPILVGATTVFGGLGAQPTADSAELFVMDPVTRRVLWHGAVLPGERAITSIGLAPDGTIWGSTLGKLFRFDPRTRAITAVASPAPVDWSAFPSVWDEGDTAATADGRYVYVRARTDVYRIDPAAMAAELIATDASLMRLHSDGTLYIARRDAVYRLDEA